MIKFNLWVTLKDLSEKDNLIDILDGNYTYEFKKVDDELIFYADIYLNNIEELKSLSADLDDDIVLYGADCDILMTVKTMKELGLS